MSKRLYYNRFTITLIPLLAICLSCKDKESIQNQNAVKPDAMHSSTKQRKYASQTHDCALVINKPNEKEFIGFYDDRIEYYVKDRPNCTIFGTQPESVMYFFLDGEVNRKTYQLSHNVYQEAIKKLGNFTLVPLDRIQFNQIPRADVIKKLNNKIEINQKLTRFMLRWQLDSAVAQFEVRDKEIRYTEMSSNYFTRFNAIESLY